MTRIRSIAAAAAAVAAAALAVSPAAAKELRYGTLLAGSDVLVKETRVTFDRIAKATKGSLTFAVFANGEIIETRTALKGIGGGVVDMGHVVWVAQPTEFRHASMAANAIAFTNHVLPTSGAVAEFFLVDCKECQAEFKAAKVLPLGAEAASRYVLMCSKKIDSLDDLKGLRVRAIGTMARWGKELGMVPTGLAAPEIVTAMQRGTVPCAFALLPWLRSYSLGDAVKTIIDTQRGTALGGGTLWVNADAWQKLSPEHRKAIWDALPDHNYRMAAKAYGSEADVARAGALKAGIKITDGGAPYAEAWKRFQTKERAELVELGKRRKIANPEAFVDHMLGLMRKWDELMAGKENDEALFKSLLKSRVLDKTTLFKVGG
ncbi:MAG: hypothetical protein KIT16_06050 [Rhodospirillaceae bacterium]|nr:hypothetical protein [Rhodospirillaceae bacterium]